MADATETIATNVPPVKRIFRIVGRSEAERPFSGEHCRQGGRWSSPGIHLAYACASPGGAVLEHLAHGGGSARRGAQVMVCAQLPASRWPAVTDPPTGWRARPYSRSIRDVGDRWAEGNESLALLVPSALADEEWNVLINPEHPRFAQLKILAIRPVVIDPRLRGRRD